MKIGILTFHWATNYGAVLQCYALQQKLKDMGYDVEIINYKPQRFDFSWKRYLFHPSLLKKIKRDYVQNKKEKLLDRFRDEYLNLTRRYFSYKELCEISSKYDAIISGSDQILNPSFTMFGEGCPTPTYFLNFVNEKTKKIGYAVSFGCTTYPETAFSNAKQWITSFDKIGVRENSGLDILESFDYKKDFVIVPDPTILKGKSLFDRLNISIPGIKDYYCVYVLRKNINFDSETKVFYIDETNNPLSMEEWLGYIAYSKGLITNSFHGMIMAILFHRPFVVLLEKGTGTGMNDRFLTLLNRIGLIDRIAIDDSMIEPILRATIDWECVDRLMAEYRIIGESFLDFN